MSFVHKFCDFLFYFLTYKKYANTELDKIELLMNLPNRTLSTKIQSRNTEYKKIHVCLRREKERKRAREKRQSQSE